MTWLILSFVSLIHVCKCNERDHPTRLHPWRSTDHACKCNEPPTFPVLRSGKAILGSPTSWINSRRKSKSMARFVMRTCRFAWILRENLYRERGEGLILMTMGDPMVTPISKKANDEWRWVKIKRWSSMASGRFPLLASLSTRGQTVVPAGTIYRSRKGLGEGLERMPEEVWRGHFLFTSCAVGKLDSWISNGVVGQWVVSLQLNPRRTGWLSKLSMNSLPHFSFKRSSTMRNDIKKTFWTRQRLILRRT